MMALKHFRWFNCCMAISITMLPGYKMLLVWLTAPTGFNN